MVYIHMEEKCLLACKCCDMEGIATCHSFTGRNWCALCIHPQTMQSHVQCKLVTFITVFIHREIDGKHFNHNQLVSYQCRWCYLAMKLESQKIWSQNFSLTHLKSQKCHVANPSRVVLHTSLGLPSLSEYVIHNKVTSAPLAVFSPTWKDYKRM